MKIAAVCLTAAVALAPFTAFAQSSDAVYCKALADTYRKTNSQNMDAAVPEAINQCNQGNTAAGIPVLEKALKDAKVTLPPRNWRSSAARRTTLARPRPRATGSAGRSTEHDVLRVHAAVFACSRRTRPEAGEKMLALLES
jgi:hypothetical protein